MNLTQRAVTCLLMFQTITKVAESNVRQKLHVQLQQYNNKFNLKYVPEKHGTPYCCCANGNTCFASIDANDLGSMSCLTQCQLRFTLCAEMVAEEADMDEPTSQSRHCNISSAQKGFPFFMFDCQSAASNAYLPLNALEMNEMPDVQYINLSVIIEEQDQDGYDVVDRIHIPVTMYSFSRSEKYTGTLGIATVTLGYSFIVVKEKSTDNNNEEDNVDLPSTMNSITLSRASPVKVMPTKRTTKDVFSEGKVTRTPSVPMKVEPETITITQTMTVLATSNSSDGECTENAASNSSSVWMPVSLGILIVAVILVVTACIVMTAALCLRKRKTKFHSSDADLNKRISANPPPVENVLYAIPLSSTTNKMTSTGNNQHKGVEQETLAIGIADALYELPSSSTMRNGQHKREVFLTDSVPTQMQTQQQDYLELSSATIPPCDYLCPKDSNSSN